jgi:hypothetical protein
MTTAAAIDELPLSIRLPGTRRPLSRKDVDDAARDGTPLTRTPTWARVG